MGNLTLPPDPQNTPGSFPGQKPSVVWEVLGLGYTRVKKRKEREERIPLKGKREKSLILLDNGGWTGSSWGFGSSLRSKCHWPEIISSPRTTRAGLLRESAKKLLKSLRRGLDRQRLLM